VQRYPVRTSHRGNLDPDALRAIVAAQFEAAERTGDAVTTRWGAIERLSAKGDRRDLVIDRSRGTIGSSRPRPATARRNGPDG